MSSSSTARGSRGVTIERQPLWNNRKHEHGPFDIIGDVHGCYDELETFLTQLGYGLADDGRSRRSRPPHRTARRSSLATWWIAGRRFSTGAEARDERWWTRARPSACPATTT